MTYDETPVDDTVIVDTVIETEDSVDNIDHDDRHCQLQQQQHGYVSSSLFS